MGDAFGKALGVTVTLVALYLFLKNGDEASRIIRSLAAGWSEVTATFQGRGGSYLA